MTSSVIVLNKEERNSEVHNYIKPYDLFIILLNGYFKIYFDENVFKMIQVLFIEIIIVHKI